MDFFKSVKQAIQILKLDENAISEVASNPNSTIYALVITIIAGFASGVVYFELLGVKGVIEYIVFLVVSLGVIAGISHILAKLAGGKGEYMHLFRVLGLLYITNWTIIIPLIGQILTLVLSVWKIVVGVITVKSIYKLSTIRAILVVMVPVITFVLIIVGYVLLQFLIILYCLSQPSCVEYLHM